MIAKKLEDAINEQIKWELFSAYLYKAMAGYFLSIDMKGFATWMQVQALEEMTHADKFFNYLCEVGGRTELRAIDAPKNDYKSPLDAFDYSYKHELQVTKRINDLMTLAKKEKDHALEILLQWFVNEQVEEEASFGQVLSDLKLVKDDGRGLLMLNRELGARVFVPPAAQGA